MNQLLKCASLLGIGMALWTMEVPNHGEIIPNVAKPAQAIVGAPLTPVSVAGTARRTTRRVVATEAAIVTTTAVAASTSAAAAAKAPHPAAPPPPPPTAMMVGSVVPALPSGCQPATVGGVSYSYCQGVYYRAGFQGNNVVYVVSQP